MKRENLTKFVWLSIFAAVFTISLKATAYYFTNSVGLLSDALESVINLIASVTALILLKIAATPPDKDHAYGHDKAEYFTSGIEGALILLAAISIAWAAVPRLFTLQPLTEVNFGLIISGAATLVNLSVGLILVNAGRRHDSVTLDSDGKHLLTDVWTSVGVIIGILAASLSGWLILDPLIALAVAANITWMAVKLMRRSALGLMDTAVSFEKQAVIKSILDDYADREGIEYHALRTRQSATRQFVAVHVVVPGEWTVHRGHLLLDKIEADINRAIPYTIVFTHLESLDDPASWRDIELDHFEGRL